MKKFYFVLLCAITLLVYSCKRVDDVKPPKCIYTASEKLTLFSQRWLNTFTQIDTYNSTGTSKTTSLIYPLGYFQLNGNNSYNVFSDNVPLDGNWTINSNCQLVLDSGKTIQRDFDVITLTKDSLTIRRKQNNMVYIQHYKTFLCPSTINSIQYQWDNALIRNDYYLSNSNVINSTYYSYDAGYFKINTDATYNVVSGNDVRNGKWTVEPEGCKLVLDKATNIERSFDIIKFTADSLVIWRKDAAINIGYTQHYKKH